jgi:hypothetical protein
VGIDHRAPADGVDGRRPSEDEAIAREQHRVFGENEVCEPGARAVGLPDSYAGGSLAGPLVEADRPPAAESGGGPGEKLHGDARASCGDQSSGRGHGPTARRRAAVETLDVHRHAAPRRRTHHLVLVNLKAAHPAPRAPGDDLDLLSLREASGDQSSGHHGPETLLNEGPVDG